VTRPWETLDAVDTDEGRLELRRRGDDYVITVAGRVLMSSMAHLTEVAVAEMTCREVARREKPRVLIGGLGMGYTLRAALDNLPKTARVEVAEINDAIVRWCRGPLAGLTRNALKDPRASVVMEDVVLVIERGGFDAIILDLYEGPREAAKAEGDPFYGREALRRTRDALTPGGIFAVWSEDPDAAFEKRLRAAGFRVERRKPGKGGPRHVVYLARASRAR
jgi:spermidine synthase